MTCEVCTFPTNTRYWQVPLCDINSGRRCKHEYAEIMIAEKQDAIHAAVARFYQRLKLGMMFGVNGKGAA